jgi:hypothetical protein
MGLCYFSVETCSAFLPVGFGVWRRLANIGGNVCKTRNAVILKPRNVDGEVGGQELGQQLYHAQAVSAGRSARSTATHVRNIFPFAMWLDARLRL